MLFIILFFYSKFLKSLVICPEKFSKWAGNEDDGSNINDDDDNNNSNNFPIHTRETETKRRQKRCLS